MRETGKFSITYLRNIFNFVGKLYSRNLFFIQTISQKINQIAFFSSLILGTIGSGICMILIPLFGANSLAINMLFILTMIFAGSLCSGKNGFLKKLLSE